MVSWLDRLQQRNRAVGFVIAVIYKYVDDQGGYLAALITYYAFVSLFPLLLLLTTALSVVLVGHPDLQRQVLRRLWRTPPFILVSAIRRRPFTGTKKYSMRTMSPFCSSRSIRQTTFFAMIRVMLPCCKGSVSSPESRASVSLSLISYQYER